MRLSALSVSEGTFCEMLTWRKNILNIGLRRTFCGGFWFFAFFCPWRLMELYGYRDCNAFFDFMSHLRILKLWFLFVSDTYCVSNHNAIVFIENSVIFPGDCTFFGEWCFIYAINVSVFSRFNIVGVYTSMAVINDLPRLGVYFTSLLLFEFCYWIC